MLQGLEIKSLVGLEREPQELFSLYQSSLEIKELETGKAWISRQKGFLRPQFQSSGCRKVEMLYWSCPRLHEPLLQQRLWARRALFIALTPAGKIASFCEETDGSGRPSASVKVLYHSSSFSEALQAIEEALAAGKSQGFATRQGEKLSPLALKERLQKLSARWPSTTYGRFPGSELLAH